MANAMNILKKIWKYLDLALVVVLALLAAFGIISLKKKLQRDKDDEDVVSPDEIKPGTDVVKPGTFDPKPDNPFDDDYTVVTPAGDEIDTPIPDDKIGEIIQPEGHVIDVKPKHEKKSNSLLDKIKKYKADMVAAKGYDRDE